MTCDNYRVTEEVVVEKSREFNIEVHQIFVDLKEIYSSVDLPTPVKLRSLTKMKMSHTKPQVSVNNSLTDTFETIIG